MVLRVLPLAALLVFGARAQEIPTIGTLATLDVATWNIEHFGNDDSGPSNEDLQLENVLDVIRTTDVDLWALQELDIEAHFERLLDSLGVAYEGFWQADETSNDIGYGFLYKTAVVDVSQISKILEDSSYEFAFRPPLQLRADVILPDTTVEVRFINVHMKCCGGSEDYERRVAASEALKNFTDNLQTIGANVLVLGDFNDELVLSIHANRTSPYQNFLDDEDYLFVTRGFDLPGGNQDTNTWCSSSTCSSGSVLDHMVATKDLGDDHEDDSADHLIEVIDAIGSYTSTTSDHLPVFARFDFLGMPTVVEGAPIAGFSLDAVFPNPFVDRATLSYTLGRPAPVRVEVFDMLGRRVLSLGHAAQAAGSHRAHIDGVALPPGVYAVRLTAGEEVETVRVVRR